MAPTPKVSWNSRDSMWFFKYRKGDGSRSSKFVPKDIQDERTAQRWANQWWGDFLRNGNKTPPRRIDLAPEAQRTLLDLSQTWLDFRRNHPRTSSNTYDQFVTDLRSHVLNHPIAKRPIVDLSPHVLVKWLQETGAKVAPNTLGHIKWTLSEFLKDIRGQEWGVHLSTNPLKDEIVLSAMPRKVNLAGKGTVIHLTAPQASVLLAADPQVVPPHRLSRHAFELYTGAREGETSGLAWGHLHLEVPIPYADIERQLLESLDFAPPKKDSFRQIPLHPRLVMILCAWRDAGWPLQFSRRPNNEDPVWPATRGRREGTYYRPAAGRRLRSDLKAVGLPQTFKGHDIDAHALRRTFATLLDDAGVAENRIGPLMGHAGRTVTDRNYIGRNLQKFLPAILQINL